MKKICDDDREKSDGLTIACQPLRTRTPGTAMGFQTAPVAGRAFLQGIFFFLYGTLGSIMVTPKATKDVSTKTKYM